MIQPAPGTKISAQAWVDPASADPTLLIRMVEIVGSNPRTEAETARRFDEEDRSRGSDRQCIRDARVEIFGKRCGDDVLRFTA